MEISAGGIKSNPLKTRRKRFGLKSSIFLAFVGIVFIVGGVGAYNLTKINSSWTRVEGKVAGDSASIADNGKITYTPELSYSFQSQVFTIISSTSSFSYPKIGSEQEIAYNPASPLQAKIVSTVHPATYVLGFPILGFLFLLLSVKLFRGRTRREKRQHLSRKEKKQARLEEQSQLISLPHADPETPMLQPQHSVATIPGQTAHQTHVSHNPQPSRLQSMPQQDISRPVPQQQQPMPPQQPQQRQQAQHPQFQHPRPNNGFHQTPQSPTPRPAFVPGSTIPTRQPQRGFQDIAPRPHQRPSIQDRPMSQGQFAQHAPQQYHSPGRIQ